MRSNNAVAYVTGFNIDIYPRPLFIKHALGNLLRTYILRTIVGYSRDERRFQIASNYTGYALKDHMSHTQLNERDVIRLLPKILGCPRIDRADSLTALLIESLYVPFFGKISERTVIILNTVGALAAMRVGKKVIIDLMDLWSCSPQGLRMNALDFYVLRKAEQVWAWSKAIAILLKRIGINNVKYVPFGIDLNQFDPMKVPTTVFFERYRDLEGKILIGYSGGMWYVNGEERIGVEKIVRAFKLIEREVRDDAVLVLQTSRSIIPIVKRYGIKNYVYVNQTRFNDPLRLSLLRALDIKVLTATKFPSVYLAERSTMFQYMTSGGAIIAEKTPGALGVLRHMYNAYMVNLDDINAMAQAMLELINDKELRNKLGINARRDIETTYNWRAISHNIKNYLEL